MDQAGLFAPPPATDPPLSGPVPVPQLFTPELSPYLDALVPPRHEELTQMEEYAAEVSFPIIGAAAGNFCYLLARLMGARRVFELGSGFGYSTAWLARAVLENGGGEVHHTVWDEGLSGRARQHLRRLGLDHVVHFTVGESVEALRAAEGPFDLVFNDIDKEGYPSALPIIADKLREGGILIVDNVLWSGRIFDPFDDTPATAGIKRFTAAITADPAWTVSIAPIRDGLLVARKNG